MGFDGSTKPSRSDLLRRSSWRLVQYDKSKSTRGGVVTDVQLQIRDRDKELIQKEELARFRWTVCSLSGEKLRRPILACRKGFIYNKEAVLEFFLGTHRFPENVRQKLREAGFAHLKSMKDLFEIHLTDNPAAKNDPEVPLFICPVTAQESSGAHSFVALHKCGHCVSERGLRMEEDGLKNRQSRPVCLICGRSYVQKDVIRLNPEPTRGGEKRGGGNALVTDVKQSNAKEDSAVHTSTTTTTTTSHSAIPEDSSTGGGVKRRATDSGQQGGSAVFASLFLSKKKKTELTRAEDLFCHQGTGGVVF